MDEDTPIIPKRKKGLRIRYNAPVILTFTIICTVVLALNEYLLSGIMERFFTVPGNGQGFKIFSLYFFRLFTHAIGHANWEHLVGNFTFILLIGPILEEKYGSIIILEMMFITALVTGLLNVFFFASGLLGASGIVFMLILLISFTNIKSGEIPITFILIVLLFIGKEVVNIFFAENNVSEFAHIIGGIAGGIFGFIFAGKMKKKQIQPAAVE